MLHSQDDDYIPAVGSSFDKQMREAKIRADLFSKSLHDAREQEASALKALEEERSKWKQSFEEKSMMIEQLERELTSTVESLDRHKSSASLLHHSLPGGRSQFEKDDELRHLVEGPSSSDIKLFTTDEIDKTFRNIVSTVQHQLPSSAPLNRLDHQYSTDIQSVDPKYIQFRNSFNRKNNISQSNKAVDSTTDNNNDNNNNEPSKQVLKDIIANYEEQLKKNQAEIQVLVEEKQRLKDQVLHLDLRVAAVGEEREQYLSALNNAEGKLQFRVSQILEYEEQKEIVQSKLHAVTQQRDELSSQLSACRQDLSKSSTDLKEQAAENSSLETQLKELLRCKEEQTVDGMAEQLKAAETYSKELHRQLNEIHRSYSVQLEESGRTVSNLQQVVRALEQSRDGFHSRTFIAERDAHKYKAERDALLALVNKFHSINGQAVHNKDNNYQGNNNNHAVIPTDYRSSSANESNEMQLLTDHLSVLSALQAANQDPQRYYRSMQSGATHDSSAPTPAPAVGSGTGSSHNNNNNNNNYQGSNNSNVDYRVMDKLLGREQPSSVHGKIIQYSAPPNIPPTQQMMQSTPPNIPLTQQMMQSAPPNIPYTQQMMQSTSPAPVRVPDPTPYRGHTGSPVMDIQRSKDDQTTTDDDDRRQQQMQSMTLDDSDLQLDEYDEYEHADNYADDDQSVDEDIDDNLEDSATGNVLSHRASNGTARDGRVTASSYAPKPSLNPYMAALYAHSLDERRPESSQADHATRMMQQQQQLSRVRHTRRVRPTRRASSDDHHPPTVKRPHKASKLVSKDTPPVKSRSVVSSNKRPAAPHYTTAAPFSSVGRSPINAASTVKSTTAQHAIMIPSPSSAPTNKTTLSAARSNAASPSLSNTRRGSVSPKLYASTASSASKVKATTAAVNSSLTSLSFEQPPAKQPGKADKKLVKVFIPRSYTVRDSTLFPPQGVNRPPPGVKTDPDRSLATATTTATTTTAVTPLDPTQQPQPQQTDITPDGTVHRTVRRVFDDSDCESDAFSNTKDDQLNNRRYHHATREVNDSKIIIASEEEIASASGGRHDDRYHDNNNHSKSTTTLNMSNSYGSSSVDDATHPTVGAMMHHHHHHPQQRISESIRRRTTAAHGPSLSIPKRLMPGIAVLDSEPRYRPQMSMDDAAVAPLPLPLPPTHNSDKVKKKKKSRITPPPTHPSLLR